MQDAAELRRSQAEIAALQRGQVEINSKVSNTNGRLSSMEEIKKILAESIKKKPMEEDSDSEVENHTKRYSHTHQKFGTGNRGYSLGATTMMEVDEILRARVVLNRELVHFLQRAQQNMRKQADQH